MFPGFRVRRGQKACEGVEGGDFVGRLGEGPQVLYEEVSMAFSLLGVKAITPGTLGRGESVSVAWC